MAKQLSHIKRKERREKIVSFVKLFLEDLSTSSEDAYRYHIIAAEMFGVTENYVLTACKNNSIFRIRNRTVSLGVSLTKSSSKCRELLRTTELDLKTIAKRSRLSKQRVHQIYTKLKEHENIPARGREANILKDIKKQEEFVAEFQKTRNFIQARKAVGISTSKANEALKYSDIKKITHPFRNSSRKRPIARSIRIISDLFNEDLSLIDIAEKNNCPAPSVSMLRRDCIIAGIPLPDLAPDGRLKPLSKLINTLTLFSISIYDNKATGKQVNNFIYENVPSLRDVSKYNFSATRSRLVSYGLVTSNNVQGISIYSLTGKGQEEASLITNDLITELVNDFLLSQSTNVVEEAV